MATIVQTLWNDWVKGAGILLVVKHIYDPLVIKMNCKNVGKNRALIHDGASSVKIISTAAYAPACMLQIYEKNMSVSAIKRILQYFRSLLPLGHFTTHFHVTKHFLYTLTDKFTSHSLISIEGVTVHYT